MMPVGPRGDDAASLSIAVPAALPMKLRAKMRELVRLKVAEDERGKGKATRLLQQVCAEADDTKTALMLHVEPQEGADMDRLVLFYERHGFVMFQARPPLMARVAS